MRVVYRPPDPDEELVGLYHSAHIEVIKAESVFGCPARLHRPIMCDMIQNYMDRFQIRFNDQGIQSSNVDDVVDFTKVSTSG